MRFGRSSVESLRPDTDIGDGLTLAGRAVSKEAIPELHALLASDGFGFSQDIISLIVDSLENDEIDTFNSFFTDDIDGSKRQIVYDKINIFKTTSEGLVSKKFYQSISWLRRGFEFAKRHPKVLIYGGFVLSAVGASNKLFQYTGLDVTSAVGDILTEMPNMRHGGGTSGPMGSIAMISPFLEQNTGSTGNPSVSATPSATDVMPSGATSSGSTPTVAETQGPDTDGVGQPTVAGASGQDIQKAIAEQLEAENSAAHNVVDDSSIHHVEPENLNSIHPSENEIGLDYGGNGNSFRDDNGNIVVKVNMTGLDTTNMQVAVFNSDANEYISIPVTTDADGNTYATALPGSEFANQFDDEGNFTGNGTLAVITVEGKEINVHASIEGTGVTDFPVDEPTVADFFSKNSKDPSVVDPQQTAPPEVGNDTNAYSDGSDSSSTTESTPANTPVPEQTQDGSTASGSEASYSANTEGGVSSVDSSGDESAASTQSANTAVTADAPRTPSAIPPENQAPQGSNNSPDSSGPASDKSANYVPAVAMGTLMTGAAAGAYKLYKDSKKPTFGIDPAFPSEWQRSKSKEERKINKIDINKVSKDEVIAFFRDNEMVPHKKTGFIGNLKSMLDGFDAQKVKILIDNITNKYINIQKNTENNGYEVAVSSMHEYLFEKHNDGKNLALQTSENNGVVTTSMVFVSNEPVRLSEAFASDLFDALK